MKSIKRTMAMCAAATLVFSAMSVVPASAADPTISVDTSATGSVAAGDEITITISIENNPGINVAIYDLTYDDTIFEVVPSGNGIFPDQGTMTNSAYKKYLNTLYSEERFVLGSVIGPATGVNEKGEPLTDNEHSPATFVWNDGTLTNEDNGTIVEVTFKVKETAKAGTYTFDVTNLDFQVIDEDTNVASPVIFTKKTSDPVKVEAATVAPTELSVTPDSIEFSAINHSGQIVAKVSESATDQTVSYKSSDESVATVSATGLVTAVKAGTAVITVTANGNKALTKDVMVTVHTYEKVAAVDPTCQKEGNIEYYKRDDGKFFDDDKGTTELTAAQVTKAKLAHDFTKEVKSDKTLKTAGTCKTKAVYFYTCALCGEEISTDKTFEGELDPDNHVNTKLVDAVEATFETEGYTGDLVCQDCGEIIKKGEKIPVKTHTYTKVAAVAATCETAGNIEYYKREDGKLFNDDKGTKELTEAETVVAALGHKYGEPKYEFSADYSKCTATMVCENDASHTVTETVATVEKVTVEPTYDATGKATYTASFKNAAFKEQVKEVELPAKVHTYTAVDAKAATCEAEGNKAYYVRDDGKLFEDMAGTKETTADAVKIPATGHDYEKTEAALNADNTKIVRTLVCKNDKSHTTTIEAAASVKSQKDATCSEAGEIVYTADFSAAQDGSDVEEITVSVDKLEHQWGEWVVTKEATEEEEGEETRTCSVCNETETRAIDKLTPEEPGDDNNGDDEKKDDEKKSDDKKDDGKKSDNGNKDGSDNKGDANGNGNGTAGDTAATGNPVTGTAAALGVVAAALGSLAIFRKRK